MSGPDRQATDPPGAGETDDAFLSGALMLLQPARGFRAGIDAVLLAAAVPDLSPDARCLDAGAGVGTAGLCLARRLGETHVTLVERAPALAALARRNAARNGLSMRVTVVEADLLAPAAALAEAGLAREGFECLLANPPWQAEGRGRAPLDPVEAAANSMPEAALDGWMRCLARLAAPDALLVMVHRADALGRVLAALGKRFGAAEVLPLQPREGRPATRIIVRARKGSRAPLILHAGLAVHEADGSFRPAVAAALRHGEALRWPTG